MAGGGKMGCVCSYLTGEVEHKVFLTLHFLIFHSKMKLLVP